ncbi:unnamed protein product [Ilex paraguariensis]|uniref:Bifunctional inhibitor/plant lipid transfer protein/seed storage helical domain-containing protein n=1 Tax=Ilex paraguariensis TaxID=185542 RepID=A0ABC8SU06_9AQUA
MESLSRLISVLSIALIALYVPVYGQTCTPSMLSTFTPCMNFITNSSTNGTSPSSNCCNSLRSLASNGTECLCLIVTGNVPFQLPINQTLAISLPRACNMSGVPLQCKASGAPLPAPGPAAFGPSLSPKASPSNSPEASTVPEAVSPAPVADTTPALAPPSQTTTNSGIRPIVNPSSANPSHSLSPAFLVAVFVAIALKYY